MTGKEQKPTNNQMGLGENFFLVKLSDETPALADAMIAA